jgi:hypothetical protein
MEDNALKDIVLACEDESLRGREVEIKLLRRKSNASGALWSADDLMFRYDEAGLSALFLTRALAKTRLDARVYEGLFGSSLRSDIARADRGSCARRAFANERRGDRAHAARMATVFSKPSATNELLNTVP